VELEGVTIPRPVVEELASLADRIPADDLVLIAQARPSLFHGLRPVKGSAPAIRERLRKILPNPRHLELLRPILAPHSLCGAFTSVLSREALQLGWDHLAAYHGPATFLAGVLLEERAEVRELALEWIRSHPGDDPGEGESREDAAKGLRLDFRQFLELTAPLVTGGPLPAAPQVDGDKRQEDLRALQEQHRRRLEEAEAERRRLERQVRDLGREATRHQEDAARTREALREAEGEREALRGELAGTRQERDRLGEDVEARAAQLYLHRVEHGWLRIPETFARVAAAGSGDLLEAAEELLRQQEAADRHYGNRATLLGRRDRVRRLLEEVEAARGESLHPIPGLAPMARRLRAEAERLEGVLGLSSPGDPRIRSLEAAVNQAADFEALAAVEEFLGKGAQLGLLSGREQRQLFGACLRKKQQLYDRHLPGSAKPPPLRTGFSLCHGGLSGGRSLDFLVDGHNMLFVLSDLFGDWYEEEQPRRRAREALVDWLDRAARVAESSSLTVYFDSPTRSESRVGDRLLVVYSGGGAEEHRADTAILERLAAMGREARRGCAVVTADADLARRAIQKGAASILPNEFAALVEECTGVTVGRPEGADPEL
jgi:predicted RNA-binding protein with PIN domain